MSRWKGKHRLNWVHSSRSYLGKLVGSYLLLTLVCVSLIAVVAYQFTSDRVRDLAIESNKKMLHFLEGTVDNFQLSGMSLLALRVAGDVERTPAMNYYLTNPVDGKVVDLLEMDSYLSELLAQNPNLCSAALYFDTSALLVSNYGIRYGGTDETVRYYQELTTKYPTGGYSLDRAFYATGESVVHLVHPLPRRSGAVILTVPSAVLTESLGTAARGELGEICIVGRDGIVLGHTDSEQIGRSVESLGLLESEGVKERGDGYLIRGGPEGNLLVSHSTSKTSDWTYIAVTPLSKVLDSSGLIARIFFLSALLAVGIGALLSYFVAQRMYGPLETITALCDSYSGGSRAERDECVRIRDAIETLSQTAARQQERVEQSLPIVRNNLLHLLLSPSCNTELASDRIELLGLPHPEGNFLVGAVRCGFFDCLDLYKVEGDRLALQTSLEECAESEALLCGEIGGELVFVAWAPELTELRTRLEQEIRAWQERTTGSLATAVLLPFEGELTGLSGSYRKLHTLLDYGYLYPGIAVLPMQEVLQRERSALEPDLRLLEQFETAAAAFDREAMEKTLSEIGEMLRSEPLSLSACKAVQERVCAALGTCAGLRGTPLPLRPESTDSLDDWLCCLREKIGEVCSRFSTRTGERSRRLVRAAMDYIRAHLEEYDLGLARVAEELGVSTGHLSRTFKSETGSSFQDYLSSLKMDYAATLLRESSMKIEEISSLLGYSTPQYFSARFKALYGMTPSAWRTSQH